MPRNIGKHTAHWLGWALLLGCGLARAEDSGEATAPAGESVPAGDAAPAADTLEIGHKFTVQGGYGPQDSNLSEDYEPFYGLRYEPSLSWFSPERQWPVWQGFVRAWFNYNSSQASTPFQEQDLDRERRQVEHFSAELREFYLRRNLIGDDPRFSLALGRQRYADYYGMWWDDSLESLRFDYSDDFASGFFAVGQRFFYYNSDSNSLDDGARSILYGFGEYAWRWQAKHWAGTRVLLEYDHSGADPDDPTDFKGGRLGLFAHGDDLDWGPISDYRVELALLAGRVRATSAAPAETSEHHDSRGWALVGDLGKRFDDWPWQPRIALRAGITDKPDDEFDGFGFNELQSDRVSGRETYSSGLLGSFISVNLRNLAFYGIAVETRPQPRHYFDVRVSDLYLRDPDQDLPLRISPELLAPPTAPGQANPITGSKSLGQVLDLNYYWEMFPFAIQGRQLNLDLLFSAGYFLAGNAVRGLDDDYQLSFGAVLRY
ncbi:alginate export family protein [Zestomonas carbonaria]|uniref:Alginate export domain-containing protein n=1 Tax=Zestomonas carbonaria TaxID=2762745 RepID=A0A7U7I9V2_9GAMM|nr:alginate export family protein [Pseudomonas carbonaria]CAD5107307.1 hypothetical protein PSEWESI4_01578 [Pseudomonas carbonaria]